MWSPDDQEIVYGSPQSGNVYLYLKDVRGASPERRLVTGAAGAYETATSWSRSGLVAYQALAPETGWDLWAVPRGGGPPNRLLASPYDERECELAPDGRSFLYESNESGRVEVYLRTLPGPSGAVPVSTGGGSDPRWRADGREIYFLQHGFLMATEVTPGDPPRVNVPHRLFDTTALDAGFADYDSTPDGQRFLMNLPLSAAPPSSITVLLHWASILPR